MSAAVRRNWAGILLMAALLLTSAITSAAPLRAGQNTVLPDWIRVDTAPAPQPIFEPMTSHYRPIETVCPQTDPVNQPPNTDITDRTVIGCPIRIYDTTNHFGSAQMDVDPGNEALAMFCSLHGGPVEKGPTPRSRSEGGSHTTFTTRTQGLSWSDQPTTPASGGFGEGADCVFDHNGNLYLGYLSSRAAFEEGVYGSTITLYKGGSVVDDNAVFRAYQDGHAINSLTAKNPITRFNLLYVPQYNAPVWVNGTNNATLQEPSDTEDYGHYTLEENHTLDRVVATWFERASDWRNSTTGFAGWINAAITDTGGRNTWKLLPSYPAVSESNGQVRADPRTRLIGPCMDASNPVSYRGMLYIACVVDAGYQARNRARIGDVDIWQIDPVTMNVTFHSTSPIRGGVPRLAASFDGRMVMTSHLRVDENNTQVQTAWGWYGKHWELGPDLGRILHLMLKNEPTFAAEVTALQISEDTHTAILIYMEHQKTQQDQIPQPDPTNPGPLPDPNHPENTVPHLTDYRKMAVTFAQCESPIAALLMTTGTGVDPANGDAYAQNPAMFQDIDDGLAYYRTADDRELFYFAINDYGAMQFGAFKVESGSTACFTIPPVFEPVAVALPQALTTPATSSLALTAAMGVGAVAISAYILAVKRKTPQYVTTEADK